MSEIHCGRWTGDGIKGVPPLNDATLADGEPSPAHVRLAATKISVCKSENGGFCTSGCHLKEYHKRNSSKIS